MIRSIFILTTKGDIIIEKHWRGYLNRSIVDQFMEEASKHENPKNVPPIIVTSKYYLLQVHVADLFFLSPVQGEVPPLLVLEFLQRVIDVFTDYFHNVTEDDLKNNFVSVYMLLEEMMDSGLPFTTEPNILKEVVPPPTLINWPKTNRKGPELPDEINSSVTWRRPVKYANNEIFFDIIEEVDAIMDQNGMIVNSSIAGRVEVQTKLSGMPDLTLRWTNPRLIEDASLHPCVRYNRFEQDKVLSFIPPDGNFTLMKYRIFQQIQPPIYCKPTITFHETGAKLNVMVGPKSLPTGKVIEDVVITIPFPKTVSTVSLEATVGSYVFDDMAKTVRWTMSKIPKDKTPMLSGSVSLTPGSPVPECNPVVSLEFRVQMFSASGLKVDSLALHNEAYRPYKGVRSITKAGIFQIRS